MGNIFGGIICLLIAVLALFIGELTVVDKILIIINLLLSGMNFGIAIEKLH